MSNRVARKASQAGRSSTDTSKPRRRQNAKDHLLVGKSGSDRHKPAKQGGSRVPPPQQVRILEKFIVGKSIVAISAEENRNRETVARIVHGTEMANYVQAKREQLYGLGDCAIATLQHALNEQKDGRLAFQLLLHIGIIPSQQEREAILRAQADAKEQDDEAAVLKMLKGMYEGALQRLRWFRMDTTDIEQDLRRAGCRFNPESEKIESIVGKGDRDS